jgi:hypothetical protein
MNLQEAAEATEKVVEAIAKVEGPLLTGVGMFVPGASPVTTILSSVLPLLIPDIERALNDVATANNGDIFATLLEFVNHIRSKMPNSPALSPKTTNMPEAS